MTKAALATRATRSEVVLSFAIPLDEPHLQTQLSVAAQHTAELAGASIDSEDDAADANAMLREMLQMRDALEAARKASVAPINAEHDKVQGRYKPVIAAFDSPIASLKKMLGDYALEQQREQRRLLAEVATVALEPTPGALTEALAAVDDAAPTKLEGTNVRSVWKPRRYAMGCITADMHRTATTMIPDEFWVLDEKKIAAFARRVAAADTPVIPGVVFEREAVVTVQR